ncbi:uncharacterized protein TNCV_1090871 [Trichonephila clavipes]|uniref:Uncharacterized protein n=1 Tax=Trichonephila clavipes TaxID=2585209 RepID=A0A8X6VLB3_TRICX|nr:uncharacterized protein TNCV_1090871 [Trichonephila clavipes]
MLSKKKIKKRRAASSILRSRLLFSPSRSKAKTVHSSALFLVYRVLCVKPRSVLCATPLQWIDFYHELNTYFNGWIDGLKIDIFNKLSDLIIADQLKRKTPFEFKEYYLDEWANMNSPVQLAGKLEEFEDFKRTLKQKSSSPFVKKQEFKFTEKNRRYEAQGKFEFFRKDKKFPASTNYNKHYEAPVTKYESFQRYPAF